MDSIDSIHRFLGQDFSKAKSKYLNDRKVRYTDPFFSPCNESFYHFSTRYQRSNLRQVISKLSRRRKVEWTRPYKIWPNPCLFAHSQVNVPLVSQEYDSWFAISMACFSLRQDFTVKVFIDRRYSDNYLSPESPRYCGMIRFRFYIFGQWEEVIIDDKLPTINKQLVFMGSENEGEFWPSLLEKAFAKVMGSYACLSVGDVGYGLTCLTAGMSRTYKLSDYHDGCKAKQKLLEQLQVAIRRQGLICLRVNLKDGAFSKFIGNGFISENPFCVTGCFVMPRDALYLIHTGSNMLVKIKSCNSSNKEKWTGRWSEGDEVWEKLQSHSQIKRELEFRTKGRGVFWMEFDDMIKHFDEMTICRQACKYTYSQDAWDIAQIKSAWKSEYSAGGCANNLETFINNPQIQFKISQEETVNIVLEQHQKRVDGFEFYHIGFAVYKRDDGDSTEELKLPGYPYKLNGGVRIAQTKEYVNCRTVEEELELDKGTYVLIPSTFNVNEENKFLVRILSEGEVNLMELNTKNKNKNRLTG